MTHSKIRNPWTIAAAVGVAVGLALSLSSAASASILIQFVNSKDTTTGGATNQVVYNGDTWNAFNDEKNAPYSLVDTDGNATGATLSLDDIYNSGTVQSNWNGGVDKSWVEADVVNGYFYVLEGGTGTATISGLATGTNYDVAIVASRGPTTDTTDRTGDYTVNGSFATDTPNGDDYNTATDGYDQADILNYNNVALDGNGDIVLKIAAADGSYGYINAMRIKPAGAVVPVPATGSLALVGFAGLLLLTRRRGRVG